MFGVKLEILETCEWTEQARGLKRPSSIQVGMLEFNPFTVQTSTKSKFSSLMGRSQRIAILEVGLVNPEKISEFLQRMRVDQRFRIYYYGLYDSLRFLYRRIYDEQPLVVVQAYKHWSNKVAHVLSEEPGALD